MRLVHDKTRPAPSTDSLHDWLSGICPLNVETRDDGGFRIDTGFTPEQAGQTLSSGLTVRDYLNARCVEMNAYVIAAGQPSLTFESLPSNAIVLDIPGPTAHAVRGSTAIAIMDNLLTTALASIQLACHPLWEAARASQAPRPVPSSSAAGTPLLRIEL